MLAFTYPLFLWGLLALAAPLLLHLLNRQRPKRLLFPSIRFLQFAQLPREGRKRLQDWLLLLCRMLIFALLALIMAKPYWQKKKTADQDGRRKEAIFLLDSSASMQAENSLQTAKELIAAELDELDGWHCGLMLYDASILQSLPLGAGKADIQALLAAWQPGYLAGRPERALPQALAAFSPDAAQKRLYAISDFQRGDWKLKAAQVPVDIQLRLLPAAAPSRQNCSISKVQYQSLGGGRKRVLVHCRNYAGKQQERLLSVKLGNSSQSRKISLAAGQNLSLGFVFEQPQEDRSRGLASLSQDDFAPDDQYYYWAEDPPPAKVLLLLADSEQDQGMAAHFLQTALEAEQEGVPGRFEVQTLPAEALFAASLDQVQLVFLLGAAERLSSNDFAALLAFMQKGGALLHCPGAAPNLSWHALKQHGLADIQYAGMVGENADAQALGLGWLEPNCALAAVFTEENRSDLFMFNIRKHALLKESSQEKVLLRSLDKQAMLLERRHGEGYFYSFSFAFNLNWSDFPLTQSFLPMLRELCSGLTNDAAGKIRLACGQTPPEIKALDGTVMELDQEADLTRPGLARMGEYALEINLNPSESDPATVKTADLQRFLQSQEQSRQQSASHPPPQGSLWLACATLLAVLILLELLLCRQEDLKA
ncbi:MAG: BatA and WFA domain-containing protein [Lentisphaeria bacterium]|nr:BatA and WFA domain-containing protein [Lentisphaeria bacterium]